MARGGKRGNPYRDANGRFASASTGRAGLGASRAKSSPAAARKAAKSQSGRASTLAARSSLKRSRAKLAAKDPADQRLSSMLSNRAQKGAVARGNKALSAAKAAARTKLQGASAAGTISKNRPKPATATTAARPITPPAARVPAAQRPGSMTSILGGTLRALAQADAQRIREIESITGQKVRAPKQPTKSVATVRKSGPRPVSGTLGDNLRQLAQSDARFMRGMAEIARDATPKVAGGRGRKAIGGGKKALPLAGSKLPAPKHPSRAKGSRTRLPRTSGVVVKPKALKPGALAGKIRPKDVAKRVAELRDRASKLEQRGSALMGSGRQDGALVNIKLASRSRQNATNAGLRGLKLFKEAERLRNKADRIEQKAAQSSAKALRKAAGISKPTTPNTMVNKWAKVASGEISTKNQQVTRAEKRLTTLYARRLNSPNSKMLKAMETKTKAMLFYNQKGRTWRERKP